MGFDMTGHNDIARFKLPVTLDLGAAEGFLEALRHQLQARPDLRLDASQVEVLTLPCLQVILSALRTYDQMSIENPTPACVSAFEDLGLGSAELRAAPEDEPAAVSAPQQAAIEDHMTDPRPIGDPDGSAELPAESLSESPPEGPPTPAAEEPAMAKRILTIDDSKTIRDMLMLTLADAGFEVVQAVDGQDGLDVLDREQVDVVITDINMPRMDGYEVIRQVRSNAAYKSMPILVLTTESEVDKKNLARVAGATGWMVKPFDPDRLIATINKVLPNAA
jgi:two-component system, chemotaxis family, chemotaxis protein CheY